MLMRPTTSRRSSDKKGHRAPSPTRKGACTIGGSVLAALGGMLLKAAADRMGTNRNVFYKLLHDARKRFKKRMAAENLAPQEVLSAFDEG
jgi:hypothetical protein